jgi:eukaryotic-like serine/threonine-protein kinase
MKEREGAGPHDVTTPFGLPGERPKSSGESGGRTLRPGELISGRYRVGALLGEGGMGEVYEVLDLELDEKIALKTIRTEIASDETAVARFRREVQLARRVTHPNVSRLFDVGSARIADATGAERNLMFVTMELLRGETLSERLDRCGKMATTEALPIVQQICAGLGAAHQAGVVHRDFKSANVMLVDDDRSGRTRAVITDFGLARAAGSGEKLTTDGQMMGTAAYMAPEQFEGDDISPAADIYALGVVMYKMLSNALPFSATTPIQAALARLQRPPQPLRDHLPDIDRRWEAVINCCLSRDPRERFASADAVSRALIDSSVPIERGESRRRLRRWLAVVVLTGLIATAAVWTLSQRSESSAGGGPAGGAGGITPRRTVAVLGFRNLSQSTDADWLSAAFAEMLTTELAAGETLRAVPGDEVARMRLELGPAVADAHGLEPLSRIRALLGADYVIGGAYLVVGEATSRRIRLDVRLHDARNGELMAALSENGSEAAMIDLISRTGARLRHLLGVSSSLNDELTARMSMPSNPRAARHYVDGLEKLRLRDAQAARPLFLESISIEPDFPLSHAALAEAWTLLGYDGKAAEEARRAFELSSHLGRQERLEVEARFHAATNDWRKAEEVYRSLMTFFPDQIEYGLRLADVQSQSGRAQEALEVIAGMRRLPPPIGDDPRIDIVQADVSTVLGDYETVYRAAASAAAKARARGSRLLLAEARLLEGWGLVQLSRDSEAIPAFDEAEAIYRDAGDHGGLAQVWRRKSLALRNSGDVQAAIRLTRQSLELYQQIGNRRGTASALGTIGVMESALGEPAKAREAIQRALETYQEIGDRVNVAWALSAIATTYQRQGDYGMAEKYHLEALPVAREVGDVSQQGVTLHNLGEVYLTLGRLDEAGSSFSNALTAFSKHPSGRAYSLATLSAVHLARGEMERARAAATEALEIRREISEQYTIPSSEVALALVAAEEGRIEKAMALARDAVREFIAQERIDESIAVRLLLVRLAVDARRLEEAKSELASVRPLAEASRDSDLRDYLTIEEGRVAIAGSAATDVTLRNLERVIAAAGKRGAISVRHDAEIQAAQVERTLGRREAALRRLRRVEREAKDGGFHLVARKAGRLATH